MTRLRPRWFLLLVLGVSLLGCAQPFGSVVSPSPAAQLANPAATHCAALGYASGILVEPSGQRGTCTFPDGSSCDDWAFLRGECGQPFSACARAGGRLGAVFMGPDGPVTDLSSCLFSDGSFCPELDLAQGNCRFGQRVA